VDTPDQQHDQRLFAIACVSPQTCWAVGGTAGLTAPVQVILHTEDGGSTWNAQQWVPQGGFTDPLFGVTAIDQQTAWAVVTSG